MNVKAPDPPEGVVIDAVLDDDDWFPAASNAFTVYEYVVEPEVVVSVNDVEVDWPICVPLRKT